MLKTCNIHTHQATPLMIPHVSLSLSVNLMKSKLDPEGLGIILLGQFLLEFFPDQVLHAPVSISC